MITSCTLEDSHKIVRLLRGLNRHHAAHLPDRFHDMGSDAALEAFLRSEMAQGATVLAYVIETVPRAYLMWRLRPAAPDALAHPRKLAVLDHIYVDPSWRRRGIARRLIARFEHDIAAQGCTGWLSLVHRFNRASAATMENAGATCGVEVYERTFSKPN